MKVYLASPFFNEEQIERIEMVEKLLDENGFDVFSPRKEVLITKESTQDDMINAFKADVENIDDCDFMLAILDGHDTGTLFETGYAYAKNKPILYFNETRPEEKGPNLMLAMSGKLPFIMYKDARQILNNVLYDIAENGLIEVMEKTKNLFKEVE